VRSIARDPDILVDNEDKLAVFEIKVSPEKRDFTYIMRQRTKYLDAGIGFYLIGGHVSMRRSALEAYVDQDWACFLHASKNNRELLGMIPTLDQVLANAISRLTAA